MNVFTDLAFTASVKNGRWQKDRVSTGNIDFKETTMKRQIGICFCGGMIVTCLVIGNVWMIIKDASFTMKMVRNHSI